MEPSEEPIDYDEDMFVYSREYQLISRVVVITCAILSILLVSYHFITKWRNHKSPAKKTDASASTKEYRFKKTALNITLNYCLISALLMNIIFPYGYFPGKHIIKDAGPNNSCYIVWQIGNALWVTNKTGLFYAYFLRLDVTYKATSFEVKKCVLNTFYILFIINLIYIKSTVFITKSSSVMNFNHKYGFCQVLSQTEDVLALISSSVVALTELVVSIVALVSFLRPLCFLKKVDKDGQELHDTIIKIGLLNSIIIISSLIAMVIFANTTAAIFYCIDNVINSFCIILLMKIHHGLYKKVCFVCIGCECCQYNNSNLEQIKMEPTGKII